MKWMGWSEAEFLAAGQDTISAVFTLMRREIESRGG